MLGNKESVGYIAYRIGEGDGKFPRRAKRRKEILMALCLAAIFEGSGRSRTLLYRALCKGRRRYGDEVTGIIDDIESNFEAYAGSPSWKRGKTSTSSGRPFPERCLSKTGTGTASLKTRRPTNH